MPEGLLRSFPNWDSVRQKVPGIWNLLHSFQAIKKSHARQVFQLNNCSINCRVGWTCPLIWLKAVSGREWLSGLCCCCTHPGLKVRFWLRSVCADIERVTYPYPAFLLQCQGTVPPFFLDLIIGLNESITQQQTQVALSQCISRTDISEYFPSFGKGRSD